MSKEYNDYLDRHRAGVRAAASMLIRNTVIPENVVESLLFRVRRHDESKYRTIEYEAYDAYFYDVGTEGKTKEEIEKAFDRAFLEHMHVNDHHWQHWVLPYDDSSETKAIEMPEDAVYEMVCDWWSFSLVNKKPGEIDDWYESHKNIMILNERTRTLVENILEDIWRLTLATTEMKWQELYSQFGID